MNSKITKQRIKSNKAGGCTGEKERVSSGDERIKGGFVESQIISKFAVIQYEFRILLRRI